MADTTPDPNLEFPFQPRTVSNPLHKVRLENLLRYAPGLLDAPLSPETSHVSQHYRAQIAAKLSNPDLNGAISDRWRIVAEQVLMSFDARASVENLEALLKSYESNTEPLIADDLELLRNWHNQCALWVISAYASNAHDLAESLTALADRMDGLNDWVCLSHFQAPDLPQ